MAYSSLDERVAQVYSTPKLIEFTEVIALVDRTFDFSPTSFTNGKVTNAKNTNNGSCKLLALGQYLAFSEEQTLVLFGAFYRDDVLKHPESEDHANIRNFMVSGHQGVSFEHFPLTLKN